METGAEEFWNRWYEANELEKLKMIEEVEKAVATAIVVNSYLEYIIKGGKEASDECKG